MTSNDIREVARFYGERGSPNRILAMVPSKHPPAGGHRLVGVQPSEGRESEDYVVNKSA